MLRKLVRFLDLLWRTTAALILLALWFSAFALGAYAIYKWWRLIVYSEPL